MVKKMLLQNFWADFIHYFAPLINDLIFTLVSPAAVVKVVCVCRPVLPSVCLASAGSTQCVRCRPVLPGVCLGGVECYGKLIF